MCNANTILSQLKLITLFPIGIDQLSPKTHKNFVSTKIWTWGLHIVHKDEDIMIQETMQVIFPRRVRRSSSIYLNPPYKKKRKKKKKKDERDPESNE